MVDKIEAYMVDLIPLKGTNQIWLTVDRPDGLGGWTCDVLKKYDKSDLEDKKVKSEIENEKLKYKIIKDEDGEHPIMKWKKGKALTKDQRQKIWLEDNKEMI